MSAQVDPRTVSARRPRTEVDRTEPQASRGARASPPITQVRAAPRDGEGAGDLGGPPVRQTHSTGPPAATSPRVPSVPPRPAAGSAPGGERRPPGDPRTVTAKLQRNLGPRRDCIDRIALFTATFAAGRAQELLGGLVVAAAASAQAMAEQLAGLDSATRKARAARAFGERLDAPVRVRDLLHEAIGLEGELVAKLPPYLVPGTRFPRAAGAPGVAARAALLDRLIREASR